MTTIEVAPGVKVDSRAFGRVVSPRQAKYRGLGRVEAEACVYALDHVDRSGTDALVYTSEPEEFLRESSAVAERCGWLKEVSLLDGVIRTGRPIPASEGRFEFSSNWGYLPRWTSGPSLWVRGHGRYFKRPRHAVLLGLIVFAGQPRRPLSKAAEAEILSNLAPNGRVVRLEGTR